MLNIPLLHTSVGISCYISLEANQGKNVTVAWSTQLSHSDVNLKLKKAKLFSIKPFSTKIVSKLLWRGEISENFDACSHDEMVLGYIIYVWSVTLLGLAGCRKPQTPNDYFLLPPAARKNTQNSKIKEKLKPDFLCSRRWALSDRWEKSAKDVSREIVLKFPARASAAIKPGVSHFDASSCIKFL